MVRHHRHDRLIQENPHAEGLLRPEQENLEVLNQKGGWSEKLTSYRLAEFPSEADAKAAFPPGIECEVAVRNKKEADK